MKSAVSIVEQRESISMEHNSDNTSSPEHGNHDHQKESPVLVTADRREEAMGRDVEALPSGYFRSARFIGSYCVGPLLLKLFSLAPMAGKSVQDSLSTLTNNRQLDWLLPVVLGALPLLRRY